MQASQRDSKTFHKLIKRQRSNHVTNTDVLYIGNKKYEGDNILKAWTIHFENLGTPKNDVLILSDSVCQSYKMKLYLKTISQKRKLSKRANL
jgi:hypothetical protein